LVLLFNQDGLGIFGLAKIRNEKLPSFLRGKGEIVSSFVKG
jgi:hypothetical protein